MTQISPKEAKKNELRQRIERLQKQLSRHERPQAARYGVMIRGESDYNLRLELREAETFLDRLENRANQ